MNICCKDRRTTHQDVGVNPARQSLVSGSRLDAGVHRNLTDGTVQTWNRLLCAEVAALEWWAKRTHGRTATAKTGQFAMTSALFQRIERMKLVSLSVLVAVVAITAWYMVQCGPCCQKQLFGRVSPDDVAGPGRVVLITGTSSGIGAELAAQVISFS
jgi:hypothetical protein